jgi:4-hydroxy-3-polyprenylbenzoate decarboxylase
MNARTTMMDTGQDLHDFYAAYADSWPEDVLSIDHPAGRDQDVTAIVWSSYVKVFTLAALQPD